MLQQAFLFLLQLTGCVGLLVALFILFHIVRPQKKPADTSNRINKIRLIWYVLTREDLFVGIFPWLRNDEQENVKDVKYVEDEK